MPEHSATLKTPILFIVFNRPDVTKILFESIRTARPEHLFITADGPRPNRPDDIENCRLVREIVANITWPCEVKTLFRTENLGCKYAVSAAIDWFFEQVPEGIILEDDDVPDPSFFRYCEELLEKYRDDTRVMHISGDNFQQRNPRFACNESYYFSQFAHIWGWATWRRAWKKYDVEISDWPEIRDKKILYKLIDDPAVAHRWSYLFEQYYNRTINSYDGQWAYACLVNEGLCINPSVNLISNIGFGANATHSFASNDLFENLPRKSLSFPLIHPTTIQINRVAEKYSSRYIFEVNTHLQDQLKWFFKTRLPKLYFFLRDIQQHLNGQVAPTNQARHLLP